MSSTSIRVPTKANARNGSAEDAACRPVDRVLFVARELADDSFGHSVLRLARELRRRGKEVGLLCGGGALVAEFEGVGICPAVADRLGRPRPPGRLPRAVVASACEFGPDLMQLFGSSLAGWRAKFSAAVGCPYVVTVMAFPSVERRRQFQGDWRRGSVAAVSQELREHLVNHWRVPKEVIGVVPIGISLEDYERYRDSDGHERVPVVGMVGPLTPERGCEYFLHAAREILARRQDVQFLIAGNGPERERLRQLVRDLDIERWVTMVHHFADYRKMIAVLDVCVIPSLREGLSLDVIEAMACRKPVVATGVGAVYNVVADGETGFLAPKKDHKAIAGKVLRLIEDRDLARRIAEAAYKLVREQFSIEGSVERLLAFYSKTLARVESA